MPTEAETKAAEKAETEAKAKAAKAKIIVVKVNAEIAAYGGSFTDAAQPTQKQKTIGVEPTEVVRTEFVNQKIKSEELVVVED